MTALVGVEKRLRYGGGTPDAERNSVEATKYKVLPGSTSTSINPSEKEDRRRRMTR
jgi:hypothetical protein